MGSIISRTPQRIVDMSSQTAKFVLETIEKDKIVIFSKTYCPYCIMAKEQFNKLNCPFEVLELDGREDGAEIQDVLFGMTESRTVPQVFINRQYVGGGTDVKKMYENGSLKTAIED